MESMGNSLPPANADLWGDHFGLVITGSDIICCCCLFFLLFFASRRRNDQHFPTACPMGEQRSQYATLAGNRVGVSKAVVLLQDADIYRQFCFDPSLCDLVVAQFSDQVRTLVSSVDSTGCSIHASHHRNIQTTTTTRRILLDEILDCSGYSTTWHFGLHDVSVAVFHASGRHVEFLDAASLDWYAAWTMGRQVCL